MDKETEQGEIALPKSTTEEEIKEIKDYFAEKIQTAKERKILMDERYERTPKDAVLQARWAFNLASMMFSYVVDIYEFLEEIVDEFVKKEKESSGFTKQIKRLRKEVKKQKPIIDFMEKAFRQTESVLEENR